MYATFQSPAYASDLWPDISYFLSNVSLEITSYLLSDEMHNRICDLSTMALQMTPVVFVYFIVFKFYESCLNSPPNVQV